MKAIIDGLQYNTEKAILIGRFEARCYCTDFAYYHEALYKTAKGAYFLAGEGNARSKYAISYGDSSGPGSDITPLTSEEAQNWAENYLEPEVVEPWFLIDDA
jgi:hypothetical protein